MTGIQVEVEIDEGATAASPESISTIQLAIQAILRHEGFDENRPALVTVLLTGDPKLRQLNRDYAGEDHVTDVLSFASDSHGDFPLTNDQEPTYRLGDIAISIPQTTRQAQEKNIPFNRELAMLAIHGTLHLLGYDHATPDEERIMFGKTDDALDEIFAR